MKTIILLFIWLIYKLTWLKKKLDYIIHKRYPNPHNQSQNNRLPNNNEHSSSWSPSMNSFSNEGKRNKVLQYFLNWKQDTSRHHGWIYLSTDSTLLQTLVPILPATRVPKSIQECIYQQMQGHVLVSQREEWVLVCGTGEWWRVELLLALVELFLPMCDWEWKYDDECENI